MTSCLLAAAFLALPLCACAATPAAPVVRHETPANSPVLAERGETAAQHDERMAWFRDARFGMFIHWGLYSQAGGMWNGKPAGGAYGEWLMCNARIPMADYAALAKDFNPRNYDAEKWVLAAKDAGMKYIVITAKHHEGFAMFSSKASPFNIKDATPFGRDPLKELAAACRKHGMKLGFYYSQDLDWHHPGGGDEGRGWDAAHQGDPDRYVDGIVIPQLKEILTNYGKIDVLWFDMPRTTITKPRADRIMKAVLACNPDILVNNRLGGGYKGDTETPEQHIPPTGFPGRDWETCMTMNDTWGYKKNDQAWKPARNMVRMLCDIASKGGNYLLNVGPNELGEIPQPSLDRLKEVGAWTKANGEALYGTSASPFPNALPWGRVTVRGNKLYLMVFDMPGDRRLVLPGLENRVQSVAFLAGDGAAQVERDAQGAQSVLLPEGATAGIMPVVLVAELDGAPKVSAKAALITADQTGAFTLTASNAVIRGALTLETVPGTSQTKNPNIQRAIAHWVNADDRVTWRCKVAESGTYAVKLEYACPADEAGSAYAIAANGSLSADGKDLSAKGEVQSTGSWNTYRWSEPMTLEIPKAGEVEIELKAVRKAKGAVMNVRGVKLEKAK